MKPHELIAALMKQKGLGPYPLARKLKNIGLQGPFQRFKDGDVPKPRYTTAKPLADAFDLPLEAIYDEKVATAIATERGIKALPVVPERKPRLVPAKDAWPFPGIPYKRWAALSRDAKIEIQGVVRERIESFEANRLGKREISMSGPAQIYRLPAPAASTMRTTTPRMSVVVRADFIRGTWGLF